jgi:hypothetical protein
MKLRTKIIALVSAIILAICFFVPSIPIGGMKILGDGYTPPEESPYNFLRDRGLDSRDLPKEFMIVIVIFSFPYLFGALCAIIIGLGLVRKTFISKQYAIWVLFLFDILYIAGGLLIIQDYISYLGRRNSTFYIVILSLLAIMLLIVLLYSLYMTRRKFTMTMKLSIWQLIASFLVTLDLWVIYISSSYMTFYDPLFYGLLLNLGSGILLLTYSIMVCKSELNRSYKTLLFGILKLDFPTVRK